MRQAAESLHPVTRCTAAGETLLALVHRGPMKMQLLARAPWLPSTHNVHCAIFFISSSSFSIHFFCSSRLLSEQGKSQNAMAVYFAT